MNLKKNWKGTDE